MNSCMLVMHSGVRVSRLAPKPPNIMIMYFIVAPPFGTMIAVSRPASRAGAHPLVGAVARFSTRLSQPAEIHYLPAATAEASPVGFLRQDRAGRSGGPACCLPT